ncbi:MAG: 2-amino-4-hydroxy-6-hydroxymethyldihydropteridine diphosphokinase [Alistipes sp.]|nr:2-amino-4-hydroxy-6-hydroxymethyldihydropteridine diphosphokinase [Alistipes sp.]
MARVALLLGGNEGDMKRTLQTAQRLINERVGAVMRCSHRYQSEAWGFNATLPFTNQALEISTDLRPLEVLDAIQQIENELGRNRAAEQIEKAATGARYASRPIDIDIIFYGSEIIDEERLRIPHPLLAERQFALQPLAEIMRSFRHPVTGKSVGEMLDALRTEEVTTEP